MSSNASAIADVSQKIKYLHTLGPSGTNLEAAAHQWLLMKPTEGSVLLHETLESALKKIPETGEHAIVACAVYPELHTLVFENLHRMRMVDSFIMPTYSMVLASAGNKNPHTVSTHPAPLSLAPEYASLRKVSSNSQAAMDCADGLTEGCITTENSARRHDLIILQDFGQVPMVFTVHQVVGNGSDVLAEDGSPCDE